MRIALVSDTHIPSTLRKLPNWWNGWPGNHAIPGEKMTTDSKSILVVDDDLDFLGIIKRILENKGYSAETAPSAGEAKPLNATEA